VLFKRERISIQILKTIIKMKQAKNLFVICFIVFITSCKNQNSDKNDQNKAIDNTGVVTSTFKVWGNCEMCQETIESSVNAEGVFKAKWDKDTKIMAISYDDKKITLDQIQKKVAAAGYDNEKYKGDDSAYKALPECCQYERK
jgi:mercuric ion binding protein